jgi:hypothetical protein
MKRIVAMVAMGLLLSGCTQQNKGEASSDSSRIAGYEGVSSDVMAISPSELIESSSEVFVGEVTGGLISRIVSFLGNNADLKIVALQVKVSNVLAGSSKAGEIRVVEVMPGTEIIAEDLHGLLAGRSVVFYSNLSSSDDSSRILTLPSSVTSPLFQISSPYGVIVSLPEEGKLVWPLFRAVKKGVLPDALPGGSVMMGSSFGF